MTNEEKRDLVKELATFQDEDRRERRLADARFEAEMAGLKHQAMSPWTIVAAGTVFVAAVTAISVGASHLRKDRKVTHALPTGSIIVTSE